MPTITAIRPQKRGKRVNLFLDGRFAFALAKEMAQGLEVGKELSPEQVQALTRNDALERARDFSLRLLSYRPRSEKEVRSLFSSSWASGGCWRTKSLAFSRPCPRRISP